MRTMLFLRLIILTRVAIASLYAPVNVDCPKDLSLRAAKVCLKYKF